MRQEEPRMAINAEGDGGPWTLGRKTRAEGDSRGEGGERRGRQQMRAGRIDDKFSAR